jgi:hypothetical protein
VSYPNVKLVGNDKYLFLKTLAITDVFKRKLQTLSKLLVAEPVWMPLYIVQIFCCIVNELHKDGAFVAILQNLFNDAD